jgi:hypothetical protein
MLALVGGGAITAFSISYFMNIPLTMVYLCAAAVSVTAFVYYLCAGSKKMFSLTEKSVSAAATNKPKRFDNAFLVYYGIYGLASLLLFVFNLAYAIVNFGLSAKADDYVGAALAFIAGCSVGTAYGIYDFLRICKKIKKTCGEEVTTGNNQVISGCAVFICANAFVSFLLFITSVVYLFLSL